jgi:hypothetical protein
LQTTGYCAGGRPSHPIFLERKEEVQVEKHRLPKIDLLSE